MSIMRTRSQLSASAARYRIAAVCLLCFTLFVAFIVFAEAISGVRPPREAWVVGMVIVFAIPLFFAGLLALVGAALEVAASSPNRLP